MSIYIPVIFVSILYYAIGYFIDEERFKILIVRLQYNVR